jgi:hypothetical protein
MMEMKRIVYSSYIGMENTFKAILSIYNSTTMMTLLFLAIRMWISNEMIEIEVK